MKTLPTAIEETLLQACREDYVGLWEFIRIVQEHSPGGNVDARAMVLIRKLLSDGQIRAVEPAPDGRTFRPWNSGVEETLSRIQFEWRKLRRRPTLGEIVWFEIASGPPDSNGQV